MLEPPRTRVFVYLYQYWDEETQSQKTSKLYATLEVIHAGLGTPLYPSALEVERAHLHDGTYMPPDEIPASDSEVA